MTLTIDLTIEPWGECIWTAPDVLMATYARMVMDSQRSSDRVMRELRETRERLGVRPGDSLLLHEYGVALVEPEPGWPGRPGDRFSHPYLGGRG